MTTKGHCESSLGSFDECSAAHKLLSTLRPSDPQTKPRCKAESCQIVDIICKGEKANELALKLAKTGS